MASVTVTKLKSYLPFGSIDSTRYRNSKSQRSHDNLTPEIGFQINLDPGSINFAGKCSNDDTKSYRVPELVVRVIGARHLPAKFGLKSVEGYCVRVKLFPGSLRHDSSVQTSSWPTFNENFNFPMESATKSSFKWKQKKIDLSQPPTQSLFRGHFVVMTVFALLELPPGAIPTIRDKLKSFRRKSLMGMDKNPDTTENDNCKKDIMTMTTSETRRNLGSVTYFLDPKLFAENGKTHLYGTEEVWLPIKDITAQQTSAGTTTTAISSNTSAKGQIEMILQLANETEENSTDDQKEPPKDAESNKTHWNEMKKIFTLPQKKSMQKGLCLKVTTSKMRCSIKVKEDFENIGNTIYIKTSVFEHGILSNAWKSEMFQPTLSARWNSNDSTVTIPIRKEEELENITIKVSIATKNSMGKKIIFGVVHMSPTISPDHWQKFISNRGSPIALWYNFE